jgi:hypothetical protein
MQFAAPPAVDAATMEIDFPSKMAEKKSQVVPEAVSTVNVPFKKSVLSDVKAMVTEVVEDTAPVVVIEATSPVHVVPIKDGDAAAKALPAAVKNRINSPAMKTSPVLVISKSSS